MGGVCNSPMPPPPQGIAGNQAGGVTPSSNLCIANSRRYINPKVESDNRHLDTQEKMDRIGGEKQAAEEKKRIAWNCTEWRRICVDLSGGGKAMDRVGLFVKSVMVREGMRVGEMSRELGISRQALYKRLNGRMKYETFSEMMKVMGYEVYYGKEGKVRKVDL